MQTLKLKKNNFYGNNTFSKDVDIKKILVSNKTSFGEKRYKRFIGYLYNNNKVKPLHVMLLNPILDGFFYGR